VKDFNHTYVSFTDVLGVDVLHHCMSSQHSLVSNVFVKVSDEHSELERERQTGVTPFLSLQMRYMMEREYTTPFGVEVIRLAPKLPPANLQEANENKEHELVGAMNSADISAAVPIFRRGDASLGQSPSKRCSWPKIDGPRTVFTTSAVFNDADDGFPPKQNGDKLIGITNGKIYTERGEKNALNASPLNANQGKIGCLLFSLLGTESIPVPGDNKSL